VLARSEGRDRVRDGVGVKFNVGRTWRTLVLSESQDALVGRIVSNRTASLVHGSSKRLLYQSSRRRSEVLTSADSAPFRRRPSWSACSINLVGDAVRRHMTSPAFGVSGPLPRFPMSAAVA